MVRIELLESFRVVAGDEVFDAHAWPGRRSAELVQLLALADGHRLLRDQVIEALWPHLDADAGGANLRKAAHYARHALGDPDAVVLRAGQVALFPSQMVVTDVGEFEAEARVALGTDDAVACAAAAALYPGHLLPESPYDEWTQGARARLRGLCVELLRRTGQWELLVEIDPTDEPSYRALMRRELDAGRRPAAIRWYGRLRSTLRRELKIVPSAETAALYEEAIAGLGVPTPEFVGRQVELAQATALLRSATPGGSTALGVRGPAGVGKSAFCRELGTEAAGHGWRVIATRATEAGTPYAPLASVAEELATTAPAAFEALRERGRGVLSEMTAPGMSATTPTRHQVIGALRRLLLAVGGNGPVMLIVDDAHLADEATLDVVQHLGAAGPAPLTVVLAYRAEAAPPALTHGMGRLVRAGGALEVDLGPLNAEESAALVAAASPTPRGPEVVDRIVTLAQGNPFLTLELARSAVAGVAGLVPTARAAITARFIGLDDSTVAGLQQLALSGDELSPAAVVALMGGEEADAFSLLDVALAEGILVVAGGSYRFRHDLVRQALVEQIPPHGRLALHRTAAEALAEVNGPPAGIAWHWIDGGRPDKAVDWLITAATNAIALGAYPDALADLRPVLEHDPRHRGALSLRAEALDALGDAGAPAAYGEAAGVAGGPEAQDLQAKRALATIKQGDGPGALEILAGVEPVSTEGKLAQALAYSGAAALGYTDPAIGTALAAEARRLALRTGDGPAVAIASWAHAAAAHARGDLRSSVQTDLRETRGMPKLAVSVFDGQLCMTQRLLYGARPYADVIEFANALEAEADRLGAARGKAFAVTVRGEAKLLAGHLDDADTDLARGAALHRDIAAATGEAFSLQRRAEVALHRGDHPAATALLDEALAVSSESDVGFHLLDRIYGTRVTAAGADPARAQAALEEAEAAVRGPTETCPGCRITLAIPAAIAAAQAGDLERLADWEAAAEYLTNVVMRLPAWDAALEEVRGHHACAHGDMDAAPRLFAAAATGFTASEQPLDAARCAALAERYAAG
ncbi:MAG TPA: AAA family ATPase [Thermoleophilaceae bacterium]|nr:AAA family ATPase [Thermoleophilaceae bacterium]